MQTQTQASNEWLRIFDRAGLTPRYFATLALLVAQEMFEYYDFFLVGYLVAILAPAWHLTYGQSAFMLLSGGVGAIVGGLFFGQFSDRFGRRTLIAAGRRALQGARELPQPLHSIPARSDLQRFRAEVPALVTWDDHEVENDLSPRYRASCDRRRYFWTSGVRRRVSRPSR
jgi:hypothetical protein